MKIYKLYGSTRMETIKHFQNKRYVENIKIIKSVWKANFVHRLSTQPKTIFLYFSHAEIILTWIYA